MSKLENYFHNSTSKSNEKSIATKGIPPKPEHLDLLIVKGFVKNPLPTSIQEKHPASRGIFLGLKRPPPGSASAHPPDPTRLRGMEGAVTKTASEGADFLGLKRPPPGSASAHPPDPPRLRGMEGAVTKTASEGAAFLGLKRPPPGSALAHPPHSNRLRGWNRVQTKIASVSGGF